MLEPEVPTPNSQVAELIYRAHWLNLTPWIARVSNLNVVSAADVEATEQNRWQCSKINTSLPPIYPISIQLRPCARARVQSS